MNAPLAILDRSRFIGGSDCAAILGLSPWRTPLECYLEKTGRLPMVEHDPARMKVLNRGKRWEAPALDMLLDALEDQHGLRPKLIARNRRYIDPERDFLAAEIDAEIELDGEPVNVEVKTVHPFVAKDWGDFDDDGNLTDEIPVHDAAQCAHGLMVTGRQRCIVGALVGADNMTPYEVLRDDETIAGIREKEVYFWTEHVLRGLPPEPLRIEDVYRLFRRDAETKLEATQELSEAVAKLRQLRDMAKTCEAQADEIKFQIGCALLGQDVAAAPAPKAKHTLLVNGQPILTVRYQEQERIDSTALRAKHPEIAEQCSKTSKFFVFAPTQPKRGK